MGANLTIPFVMSLRIKTSQKIEEAVLLERKRTMKLAVIASFALLLLGLASLWFCKIILMPSPPPSFLVYAPQEDPSTEIQQVEDISSSLQLEAPPVQIAVADVASSINLPNINMNLDTPGEMSSLGGNMGGGLGSGIGGGGKGMGERKASGSAFCGRFWDLKKTNTGDPSALKANTANLPVLNLLSRYYNGRWNDEMFAKFFESKVNLFASCFFMPQSLDKEASNAYDPNHRMKLEPSRWVAIYRALVQAPVSGKFRFVGAADSVMAVRFNGQNVLQCGFHLLSTGEWDGGRDEAYMEGKKYYPYESCEPWNVNFGGFVGGDVFEVKAGEWYPMEVLISEIGGGDFGFCLLVDAVDSPKKVDKNGTPIFYLFRTAFIAPTADEIYQTVKNPSDNGTTDPPYDEDSPVWVAKPVKKASEFKQ